MEDVLWLLAFFQVRLPADEVQGTVLVVEATHFLEGILDVIGVARS